MSTEDRAEVPLDPTEFTHALPILWITADHHFGHANIVTYASRPFSAEEQDREMAGRWHATVPPEQPLLHLGDLVVGTSSPAIWQMVVNLPGQPKWLVLGNHDRPHRHALIRESGFTIVAPPELRYRDWQVRFTHRPLLSDELLPGQLNVHGHTHSRPGSADRRWINVSVEATDYRPVRLRELLDNRIDQLPDHTA